MGLKPIKSNFHDEHAINNLYIWLEFSVGVVKRMFG